MNIIIISNQFSLICNVSRWSGGSAGRDQLAMAAKVRRHWFNPSMLGSRGHLGANFSLVLY